MSAPDANASQRDAARPDYCAWVAANAGSGKTKVLIDRVARLLLAGAKPDSILCVTYTKAAASEMQSRLFERLGSWCVMDRARLAQELQDLERSEDGVAPAIDDAFIGRARELFARALETPGGLRIETIHAFCGRVLRRFPLEARVAPGFQELDDAKADALWAMAQRSLGRRLREGDRPLNQAVRAAAQAGGNAGQILAEVRKHGPRLRSFLRAHRAGAAADGVLQRLLQAPDANVETLIAKGMGEELPRADIALAQAAFAAGSKTEAAQAERLAFVLSDAPATERYETYRGVVFTKDGEIKARKSVFTKGAAQEHPILPALFDVEAPQGRETLRLRALDRAIKARRMFERSSALAHLAEAMLDTYQDAKRAEAGLDFDDLIDHTVALLSNPAAADWVLWKLDGGVAHILVDEAQDTSPRQWFILNRLGADIFDGRGAERERARTWFVVGDQKQSIYSFQGADPEKFLEETRAFAQRAEDGGVAYTQPVLSTSFRSAPEVLSFVDRVFDPKRYVDQAPFSLQPPDDADQPRHIAQRAGQAGAVEIWPLEPRPEIEKSDPWDAPLGQDSGATPKARLAARIARRIRRDIDQHAAVWEGGKLRPARAGDYLILVRSRQGGLFQSLLLALKQAKLPVAGADRIHLLDSLAVQDLLNLMRFVLCPEDDLVLAEVLKSPFFGFSDDDLIDLAVGRAGTLWDSVQTRDGGAHRDARARLQALLADRHLPPLDFLMRQLERPGMEGAPGWERMLARFGMPAREPMTALIDRAAAFDANAAPSLETFVAAIEQRGGEVKRELSGPADEVRVMTVHGAKGLEAPVVILPDTVSGPRADGSGLFLTADGAPVWAGPSGGDVAATVEMRAEAAARALREHRRLLYVALTRARDRLIICGAALGKPKEGRDGQSWHALCDQAMADLVEAGEAEAIETPDDGPVVRSGKLLAADGARPDAGASPVRVAWLDRPAPQDKTVYRVMAPSALGGEDAPVLPPFGGAREMRLRRGRLIHRLLQHLPGHPEEAWEALGDRILAREADLDLEARTEMREAALGLMRDPACAAVFAPGGRAEAPVIGEMPGRDGARIINGRVDRLAVTAAEVLVIDFKTDRPAPSDVSGVGDAYLRQMAAYRSILAGAWPGRRVRCLLAWTDGPKLMELPEDRLDAALSAIR